MRVPWSWDLALMILQTLMRYDSCLVRKLFILTSQAQDIDELLTPGYPVYFNYAGVSKKIVPMSLKVRKKLMLYH